MDLSGLTQASAKVAPATALFTAQVVRADESGLWVIPLGEDPRHPYGPCKGGWTANGTRVPPGALVALVMTDDGPWAIGVDNPALAVNDSTLAPFANPSFEILADPSAGVPAASWSDFWTAARRDPALASETYRSAVEEGTAAHGLRSLRVEARGTTGSFFTMQPWSVPAGSSLEVSIYGRGEGPAPIIEAAVYSHVAGSNPGPFAGGAVQLVEWPQTSEWLRYRSSVTLPPDHVNVSLHLLVGTRGSTSDVTTVWVDNADVDLVEIDPAAQHQDFIRRATVTLAGGGSRLVTAGGNVAWSQPLTIAAAGMDDATAPDGRFEISMPPNGTVIPVHSSSARTSHTIAGGVIALNADDALWYELPIAETAASQPGRFHILGSTSADGFKVPAHWVLVVRRCAWSSSNHAPEYRWGDSRQQDPWRTPSLNSGWIDGTLPGRFTKTGDGFIVMRGRVRNGSGSAFTLPPGYRPAVQHEDVVRDGAGAPALLTVTTAGVVTTAGSNSDHSIATRFPAAEQ